MATNFTKFKHGINLDNTTAASTASVEGDVNWDATNHKIEYKDNSAVRKVVSEDGTQTLTNKTLTSPTISSPTISSPTLSGTVNVSGLTASLAVFTDASKNLISNTISGTGSVAMTASPTFTGTLHAAAATFTGAVKASTTLAVANNLQSGFSFSVDEPTNTSVASFNSDHANGGYMVWRGAGDNSKTILAYIGSAKQVNTGNVADFAIGATGQFYLGSGPSVLNAITIDTSQGVTLAHPLVETSGGTKQTSYTTGDILYASASNTLSKLPIGSTNTFLSVVGGVPSWQSVATTVAVAAKTTTYTVLTSDYYLSGDTSGGAFDFTLPAATGSGRTFVFEKITSDTNKLGVVKAGSDTIEGQTRYDMYFLNESITILDASSGKWRILSRSNGQMIAFTPSVNWGNSTDHAWMKRQNDMLIFTGRSTFTNSSGGNATVTLPLSLLIDTNKSPSTATGSLPSCSAFGIRGGTNYTTFVVTYGSTSTVTFGSVGGTTLTNGWSNNDEIAWTFQLPISGWV